MRGGIPQIGEGGRFPRQSGRVRMPMRAASASARNRPVPALYMPSRMGVTTDPDESGQRCFSALVQLYEVEKG